MHSTAGTKREREGTMNVAPSPWFPTRIGFVAALLVVASHNGHTGAAAAPCSQPLARRRRWVSFGSMDDILVQGTNRQPRVLLASSVTRTPITTKDGKNQTKTKIMSPYGAADMQSLLIKEEEDEALVEDGKPHQQQPAQQQQQPLDSKRSSHNKNKLWPPWPFNMLGNNNKNNAVSGSRRHHSAGAVVWSYLRVKARVGAKQLQDVGSRLWFHLPPATPPLLLYTLLPRTVETLAVDGETFVYKTVIPLLSNPLARSLVLTGTCLAILSWAHSELHRIRRLTLLPLNVPYQDINRVVLPHFLPEQVPEPFLVADAVATSQQDDDEDDDDGEEETATTTATANRVSKETEERPPFYKYVPPRLQRHFKQMQGGNKKSSSENDKTLKGTYRSLKRMRMARKLEAKKVRRMEIFDELVALQAIKKQAREAAKSKQRSHKKQSFKRTFADEAHPGAAPLGYALVTGASRGIGRAIAVELARWEIPLILVARDLDRLSSLAYDLEACYGVKCCIMQADLSKPDAAEQIYKTTRRAGLHVDILVNNAGISSQGLAVDMPLSDVERMIQVNAMSVAKLAHLYGKDFKDKRRGRILMVSSVVGAGNAGPTVALYAATKSFEKMLGLSMAKELEPFGVGVTCLMPGAVRDTDFRTSSRTGQALCWKLPFYPKSPAVVAALGVRGVLRGDVEVVPGLPNRLFLKVVKPAIPQRMHNILVEAAWNPLDANSPLLFWKEQAPPKDKLTIRFDEQATAHLVEAEEHQQSLSPPRYLQQLSTFTPPPRLLVMPQETEKEDESTSGNGGSRPAPEAFNAPSSFRDETTKTTDNSGLPTVLEDDIVPPSPTAAEAMGDSLRDQSNESQGDAADTGLNESSSSDEATEGEEAHAKITGEAQGTQSQVKELQDLIQQIKEEVSKQSNPVLPKQQGQARPEEQQQLRELQEQVLELQRQIQNQSHGGNDDKQERKKQAKERARREEEARARERRKEEARRRLGRQERDRSMHERRDPPHRHRSHDNQSESRDRNQYRALDDMAPSFAPTPDDERDILAESLDHPLFSTNDFDDEP